MNLESKHPRLPFWIAFVLLLLAAPGWALEDTDIPTDAPNDPVMASADELRVMQS